MALDTLTKTNYRKKKRVGRGYGSGKGGHTTTRGTKGQKSRGKTKLYVEGTAQGASLIKRLPLLRGKRKLKPKRGKPIGDNVKYLNILEKGSAGTIESLVKHRVVDQESAAKNGIKILGDGELTKNFTVKLPVTKGARRKIEKAGGSVEVEKTKPIKKEKTTTKKGKKKHAD